MTMRIARLGIAVVAAAALGTSCVSSGVDSFEEFEGAIDGGADCAELFDIRDGFDDRADLERIDAALDSIGCESPDSERTGS